MTGLSSIYTALSGMSTQRKVMDVTAHNIANASTPGFHRQRVDLRAVGGATPGVFAGTGPGTYGVDVADVSRSYDALLESRSVREEGGRSATSLASATLDQLQATMPEPSATGLASQLDAFWGTWRDVANQPDSLAARTQLLANANSLTSSLHATAADVTALATSAKTEVALLATSVNGIADRLATLNKAMLADPTALDLLDQRDQAVTQLAKLTGAVARPSGGNQIDVYIGGRAIVSSAQSYKLDGAGGTLRWVSDNQAVNTLSGEAASLAATITDVVPRYTSALDTVAANLVSSVNALHTTGYDQTGTTGRQFFDPTAVTASTITLSTDVAGTPANIAAGAPVLPGSVAPGPLDGEQARAIAALAEAATGPDSTYRAMISGLAVEAGAATHRADLQAQVADSARQQADSVGAVSIDEEMANLTAAQRAFEASARVMTAVNDMLGFLIERTAVH